MATLKQIEDFFSSEPIALVGASRNPRKFGFMAFRELKEKGLNIIPVNRNAEEIHQVKAYPGIASLPPEVRGIIIMTKKNQTAEAVREAKARGFKQIWIQQSSENREALQELEGTDINYIAGECILMYYKPHGIHKFHRAILKFFRRYPK